MQIMEQNQKGQLIVLGLLLLAAVGIGSWKASAYVSENHQVLTENAALKTQHADLTKEIEKLHDQLRQCYPGWRPGTPIGNPIGNPIGSTPLGATGSPQK